jgi:hypothetical protein
MLRVSGGHIAVLACMWRRKKMNVRMATIFGRERNDRIVDPYGIGSFVAHQLLSWLRRCVRGRGVLPGSWSIQCIAPVTVTRLTASLSIQRCGRKSVVYQPPLRGENTLSLLVRSRVSNSFWER